MFFRLWKLTKIEFATERFDQSFQFFRMTVSNNPPVKSRNENSPHSRGGNSNLDPNSTATSEVQDPSEEVESTTGGAPEPEPDPEALIAAFPVAKLQKLEELISNIRWVIPVLPKGELEVLLDYSIALAKVGADKRCEPCMRFYREGLLVSFTRIMTDEAVSSWRLDIHKCILRNCEKLIELCVIKLDDEWFPLLDLLALVLNPANKFHIYNASRPAEFYLDEPFCRYVIELFGISKKLL